ncbi:MAG: peptide-methionine (R)-S-oxide reductase MsrB [Planctomycetota bacterium]
MTQNDHRRTFTESELRERLTPEQYRVTQEAGTERPGTGEYNDHFEPGSYACVVCGYPLFRAEDKFNAHCGWPSFHSESDPGHIEEVEDTSHGMVRTEVRCKRCQAHLGHVFPDGPPPTGLRYCINSASITHVPPKDD